MSKMSKKLTVKEREKLAQELIAADLDLLGLSPSLFGGGTKFFIEKNWRRNFNFQILSIENSRYDEYRWIMCNNRRPNKSYQVQICIIPSRLRILVLQSMSYTWKSIDTIRISTIAAGVISFIARAN